MANPMKVRAVVDGETVQVKALMSHVMETGRRTNDKGETIPAHFIQQVTVTHKGRVVLSAQWGTSISANPFLSFRFRGGARGELVKVTWVDSKGDSRTDEVMIT
jgi:sulfur-oxidizing protein SoxZ